MALRFRRFLMLGLPLAAIVASLHTPASADAATPEFRGVQLHSLWFDSSNADMDRELDLAREANANVVRVDVVWGSLETGGKGQYSPWYVEKLDRFVAGAHARDMKVIATLWSGPCWASSAPENVKQGCAGAWWDRGVGAYPPANPADYGDAAHYITRRYGTKLAALEVWNEPNLETSYFWKTSDKAGDYARLLKAAYPRAKAGNADVPVLAGALAYADRPFLDELNAHGINGYHDGISIHPYNEWRHPGDLWREQWKKYTLLPGIEWIRQGQQAAGDDKPLWITEFGWTTGTASGWSVTEALQAQFVATSFGLLGALPHVRAAVIYNLREKGADPASHEDNFGLVNRDFSPKPAYGALREALAAGGPSETPGSGSGNPPTPPDPTWVGAAPPVPAAPARPRRVKRHRVTLRVKRRGNKVAAVGRAPAGSRLRLSVSDCSRPQTRRGINLRASARGRFARRLGVARRLRGCRLTVRMHDGGAAAARRV